MDDRVRKYWDAAVEVPEAEPYRRMIHELLGPRELSGRRALDLGCSTGVTCRLLVEAGVRRVVGLDLSGRNLARARQELQGLPVDLVQMDVMDAPTLGRFDVVLAYAVLYYAEDPDVALRAAASCVAPGGSLVVGLLEDSAAARCMNALRHSLEQTPTWLRPVVGTLVAAAAYPLAALLSRSLPSPASFRWRVTGGLFLAARKLYRVDDLHPLLAAAGLEVRQVIAGSGSSTASRHLVIRADRPR